MADEEQNLSGPRAVDAPVLTPESAIEWRLITDDAATHHLQITHDRAWVTWLPSVTTFGSYNAIPEVNAQARLFSAAPALLEAAKAFVASEDALLAELRADGQLPDLTERPWSLVDGLRAAITQATGEGR